MLRFDQGMYNILCDVCPFYIYISPAVAVQNTTPGALTWELDTTCYKWVGRPNVACIVTWTTAAAVATAFTSLPEAPQEAPGHYRLSNMRYNVAFRGMPSATPMKYYCYPS